MIEKVIELYEKLKNKLIDVMRRYKLSDVMRYFSSHTHFYEQMSFILIIFVKKNSSSPHKKTFFMKNVKEHFTTFLNLFYNFSHNTLLNGT